MKFLVVDDSPMMRRIIVDSPDQLGFTDTVEAADGREALLQLDSSVGFVVTDLHMPSMSGVELTRAIRSRPGASALPVLVITASGDDPDVSAVLGAGATACIPKPFTVQSLREKISTLLSPPAVMSTRSAAQLLGLRGQSAAR